jgi:pentatricopeptide repeat-containing protein PET309
VPRRDRPFRRHPSHHLPHPIYRRSTQKQNPLECTHSGQRRNASSARLAVVATRKEVAVENFLRVADSASIRFDPELAWEAFNTVVLCDALASLTPARLLAFANTLVIRAEKFYGQPDDADISHKWGRRLRKLLTSLEDRIPLHEPEELTRKCLLARAYALTGDVDQALSLLDAIRNSVDVTEDGVVLIWELIVRSTIDHQGPVAVLDLVVTNWNFFRRHLVSKSDIIPSFQRQSLRRTVFSILAKVDIYPLVLSELRERDHNWRARAGELLIETFCQEQLADEAYAVFRELQKQDIVVPSWLHLSLIRAFVRIDQFQVANRLYFSLAKTETFRTKFKAFLSTGLHLFAHQGNISRALTCYNQLLRLHGWVSSTDQATLMFAYAMEGKPEDVVNLFHQFRPHDSRAWKYSMTGFFNVVIFAHARQGDLEGMNYWLESMAQADIRPDIYTYNMILKGFAMRGEVDSVSTILDQMRETGIQPDRTAYTSVITLLAHRQDPITAEAMYQRAVKEGVVPDRRMITALMNAHVEAGSWRGVIRAFDYMIASPTRQIRVTIEVYNTLLKAYVLIGAPFAVVSNLFVKLEETSTRPDAYSFALLIQSACDAGKMDAAADIFAEMERRAGALESHFEISVFVLTIMMAGYLRQNDKVRARLIYDNMRERGVQPTSVTFLSIIKSYSNEGTVESLRLAEDFLQTLVTPEPAERSWEKPTDGRSSALEHVYRPLMMAYVRQEKPEEVVRLYQSMLDSGGEPTIGVLTAVLDAYRRTGDIQAVQQVWPQILQHAFQLTRVETLLESEDNTSDAVRRKANLLCVPLSIYIDAISAAGLHLEIAKVWKQLQMHGFTFDAHNWNHLAVALVRAAQPERAFEVIERVILPYQRRIKNFNKSRDSNPDSPLLFDNLPPKEDTIPEPHSDAKRPTLGRVMAVKRSTGRAGSLLEAEEMKSNDFAHPLHILHQVSPSWNVWVPHEYTLRVLLLVITRLESGSMVPPVGPYDDVEEFKDVPDQGMENRNLAREILDRIYKNYPDTVRLVLDFEVGENRRLSLMLNRTHG